MKENFNYKDYITKGYLKTRAYNQHEFIFLENYILKKISQLISKYRKNNKISYNNIKYYHKIGISEKEHSDIFSAKNRHSKINNEFKKILLNKKIKYLLQNLMLIESKKKKIKLWDEKYGNLSFRIIRPFSNDGYPFSKKIWGPAGSVISVWIPIIGFSKNNTIKFVNGSNNKNYKKNLPLKTKFISNEYRLNEPIKKKNISTLSFKKGDVFIFSPKLLHSENNNLSKITRLNLEFRVK